MGTMLHEVLAETVQRYGDRPALSVRRERRWHTLSWSDYAQEARRVARALVRLGAEPGKGVALVGRNSPEWVIADVGAVLAGAVPAGIYPTNAAGQVRYVADHCEAKVAFADGTEQVEKFLFEQERMPRLEFVVQMHGAPTSEARVRRGRVKVIGWRELLDLGSDSLEGELGARIAAQTPDGVCTLIYTSGTTGDPKAVMITNTNLVWSARSAAEALGIGCDEIFVSYLPLNHLAEQMLSIHVPMATGAHVCFVEDARNIDEALRSVRPTFFLGVPRIWEKMQAKLERKLSALPPSRRKIVTWARSVGLEAGYAKQRGERPPTALPIARRLVLDPLREHLGLDRARYCETGAAPISRDTLEFFLSLGIPILEAYGMSECAVATYSSPDNVRTGKCGVVVPGTELRILDDGEICMRGPHVFKGYFKDPDATTAALDQDGWLHSGDIGRLDAEGYLEITGRKKDLLITAGGENIAPRVIEEMLEAIPAVGQAVVVGDRMKYLSALISLDPAHLKLEAEHASSSARTVGEAAKCPVFRRYLQERINEVNLALARAQTIKKFVIVPNAFSVAGGELTPTLKIRRKAIGEKYKDEIAAMYA